MIKEERPLQFFVSLFVFLQLMSLTIAWPILIHFIETGLVPRLPTAVLAMGMTLLAFLSLTCGLILDTVTRGRQEMKRLRYLSFPALCGKPPKAGSIKHFDERRAPSGRRA